MRTQKCTGMGPKDSCKTDIADSITRLSCIKTRYVVYTHRISSGGACLLATTYFLVSRPSGSFSSEAKALLVPLIEDIWPPVAAA